MLDLQRIPAARQRIVAAGLVEYLKKNPPLPAKVLASAQAVIQAGEALREEVGGPPMPLVDNSTDAVVSGLWRALEDRERALTDAVVPLGDAQRASLEATRLVRDGVFPRGIGFIHYRHSLQWDALIEIQTALERAPIKQSLASLGLSDIAEHLLKHITLYGSTLGVTRPPSDDGKNASAQFHEAFHALVVDTLSEIKDADARKSLLGVYEAQLDEHRDDLRKERSRSKKQD